MSFNLSSLFDVYSSNPRANRYLQNLSNDAMDAYLTRVDPEYVSDGSSSVQAGGITPAQYLLATEMLKRREYRGF